MAQQIKHPYNPGWSWGNAMSVAAIVIPITMSGLGLYVMMRIDSARAAEKIVTLDNKIGEVKSQSEARFEKLEDKVEDLAEKAEDMAITQAVMRANIEMLVRSQGLRPIDESTVKRRGGQ